MDKIFSAKDNRAVNAQQLKVLKQPNFGTNFIFDVQGVSFNAGELYAFNRETYALDNRIGSRISKLESEGAAFNFHSAQSEVLDLNLRLIDGDLPEIVGYMLKVTYQKRLSRLADILEELERESPLNYNQAHKHPFYRYKLVKFLYDAALGMTPETVWNGEIQSNGGIIIVKSDGEVLAYHTYHKAKFEEYLINNTMIEQPTTSEDPNLPGTAKIKENYPGKSIKPFKYGWLYSEHGSLKFKLNLQVRFIK